MFIYIGVYVIHLTVYFAFNIDLFRWAYGVDAISENLDEEYIDYCCKGTTTGSAGTGSSIYYCAIHFE